MASGAVQDAGSWRMHAALRRQAAIALLVWAVAFSVLATAYALPTGPAAALAVSDASPFVGEPLRFDASGSESHDSGNGAIVAYRFTFGDGAGTGWQESPFANHTYAAPGTVTADVTVMDGRGLEDTASVSVEVRPLAPSVPTPDLRPIQVTFVPSAPRAGDAVTATVVVLNAGNETAVSATVRFLDERPDGNLTWIGNVSLTTAIEPSGNASVASPSFVVDVAGNYTFRVIVADVRPAQVTGDHDLRVALVVLAAGGTSSSGNPPFSVSPLALGLAGAGVGALAAGLILLLRPRPPGPLEPPPETPQDRSPPPLWPP